MLGRVLRKIRKDGISAATEAAGYAARAWCSDVIARRFFLANYFTAGRWCPWHGFSDSLREDRFPKSVGMTTREERAFLHWYASRKFTDSGLIVELGPFVGASTNAICAGLTDRKASAPPPSSRGESRRLRVYDQFICSSNMVELLKEAFDPELTDGLEDGSSCRYLFDLQTKAYASSFTLHEGDLLAERHDGSAIEMLFVDAMKSPELATHIVRQFYPSLMAESGVLIQQDFVHYYTSWIHILQYRLRHLFRFVLHVPRSASAVFEVVRQDRDLSAFDLAFESVSDSEVDAAFEYSLSLIRGRYRENIHAAKAMFFIHRGRPEVAQGLVDGYVRRHGRPRLEMQHVVRALAG